MTDLFRTLLVAAQDADLARQIAAGFGPGGEGMFTTPLSADGTDPATHYISTGYIPAEFVSLAPNTTWEQDEDGQWVQTAHYPGDAATVHAYATQAGISCTLEDVEGVFSRADCSEQEPFVAMGRMGVQIVNPPADI
jgi:hypothetical protein